MYSNNQVLPPANAVWNVFGRICLCHCVNVYLSVCLSVCNALTSESFLAESTGSFYFSAKTDRNESIHPPRPETRKAITSADAGICAMLLSLRRHVLPLLPTTSDLSLATR